MKSLLLSVLFLVIYCTEQDSMSAQEKDKYQIDKLRQELIDMAENSICSDEFTCAVVGVGSKPCGGHWEYLVYSTSIDEKSLLEKADQLLKLEKEYNEKYQIASDCMMVSPPVEIICEDGKCKGVYQ